MHWNVKDLEPKLLIEKQRSNVIPDSFHQDSKPVIGNPGDASRHNQDGEYLGAGCIGAPNRDWGEYSASWATSGITMVNREVGRDS